MLRIYLYIFLFFYFAVAQSDAVAYVFSLCAGRPVCPSPWLSSLVLTVILALLHTGFQKILCRWKQPVACSYPLIALVAVEVVSLPFATWLWQLLLVSVALLLCLLFGLFQKRQETMHASNNVWKLSMPVIIRALVLSLYLGVGAAAKDVEHYELRTAQEMMQGDHRGAKGKRYQEYMGLKSLAVSHRLFAMRCYGMAQSEAYGLGQHLFNQPLPVGGSELLLFPDDSRQRLLLPVDSLYALLGQSRRVGEEAVAYFRRCAESEYLANQRVTDGRRYVAADYYLSALLLERNLDLFAKEFLRFYTKAGSRKRTPSYFAQALFLYTHTRTRPVLVYHDAVIEANWHDYSAMGDSIAGEQQRCNLLRRTYGETFWWWYDYMHRTASSR